MILVERVEIGIDVPGNRLPAAAEVQHSRRRDRHLRRDMGLVGKLLQETEVIQHRVVGGEIDLADHPHRVVPGLDARELDAGVGVE